MHNMLVNNILLYKEYISERRKKNVQMSYRKQLRTLYFILPTLKTPDVNK